MQFNFFLDSYEINSVERFKIL